MRLWNLSVRQARGNPGRVLLTLFSIVIGVAATVSVSLSIATTRGVYQQMSEALVGHASIEVVAAAGGSFHEDVLPILNQTPGVRAAAPTVRRGTILYFSGHRTKLMVFGIDPERDAQVREYDLVEGRMFAPAADEAVVDASFARSLGIRVGDEIKLLTPAKSLARLRRVKVVGISKPRGVAGLVQGMTLLMPLPVVQRMFAARRQLDAVYLALEPGDRAETLLPVLNRRLPPGVIARLPVTQTPIADQTLGNVEYGLRVASWLSLLLAGIIILNTFLMSVTERRSQIAILRVIGATRSQIIRLLMREALVLGLGGTALGLLIGVAGAAMLRKVISGEPGASAQLEVLPMPLLVGCLMGLGVSAVAALLPALRAGRVSPIEGMRTSSAEDVGKYVRNMAVCGAICLLTGLLLVALSLPQIITAPVSIPIATMILVGFVLLIPIVLSPFARVAGWPLSFFAPIESRLARRQLVRHPVRTTLTIGILFIATAVCVCMGIVILSNVEDVKNWVGRTVVADFYVRAAMPSLGNENRIEVPEDLGDELRAIPGVRHVGSVRRVGMVAAGMPVILIAKQFSPADRLPLDLKVGEYEDVRHRLRMGEAVIGVALAERGHLTVGDEIALETPHGLQRFPIAGVANEYLFGGLSICMDRDVAARELGVRGVDIYLIQAQPGALAAVREAVRKITDQNGLILHSAENVHELVDHMVFRAVSCLWVVLALAMIVASFGIVNTLTMNVLEQTRELALLRVVAMTRRQVRRTVLSQAAIIGLVSLVPGTVMGMIQAYLVVAGSAKMLGHWLDFDMQPLILACCFVGAYLIVLAAALGPARRAARLELLTALHYE